MKVHVTFDLDDDAQRWINHYFGDTGKASRSRCRRWIETLVDSTLEDLGADYNSTYEENGEKDNGE